MCYFSCNHWYECVYNFNSNFLFSQKNLNYPYRHQSNLAFIICELWCWLAVFSELPLYIETTMKHYTVLQWFCIFQTPHYVMPEAQTIFRYLQRLPDQEAGITVQLPTECWWHAANLHEVLKPASSAQPAFSWKLTLWLFVNEAGIGILLLYQYSRQLSCPIRLKKLELECKMYLDSNDLSLIAPMKQSGNWYQDDVDWYDNSSRSEHQKLYRHSNLHSSGVQFGYK